jgi:hypothetical protein
MPPIFAVATVLFNLAPQVFEAVEKAIPYAERLAGIITKGDHVSQEELEAFIADIRENSAIIQQPITE